jgi:hypothetical protein
VDGKRTCTEHTSGFEWAFEVTDSRFAEDVDGDGFGVVDVLDAHEGLDEQGLREVEIEVHDTHHGDTHVRGAELGRDREWSKIREEGRVRTSFGVSERS